MKKNSFTSYNNLKRYGVYCFFLMVIVSMTVSCVTEEAPSPVQLTENPPAQVDSREVKDWFEKNEADLNMKANDLANARKSNADKFMVPFVEKLPDWGRVHSFRFADGRQVYEVALDNEEVVVPRPVKEALGDENIGDKINQSLLFIESPGGYKVLLARYYPASEEDVRGFDGLQYNLLSEGWSGVVDIYSFEEAHVRNFMVSEGVTVMSRNYRPAESGASSRGGDCYNIWIDYPSYGIPGGVGAPRSTSVIICAEYDIPVGNGASSPYNGYYPPSGGGSGSYGYPSSGGGGSSGNGGEACMDGGTYCFDAPGSNPPEPREIIKDPSFKNTIADCIYGKLLRKGVFNKVAGTFAGVESEFDVKLKIGTLKTDVNAQTQWLGRNSPIEITINQTKLNRSALEVARTMIHEMVHAEFYRALNTQSPMTKDLSFRETFEAYTVQYKGNSAAHHNLMADRYVDYIADVLEQVHPQLGGVALAEFMGYPGGAMSREFYEALAWEGLKAEGQETTAWLNKSPEEKEDINKYIRSAEVGRKTCDQ